MQPFTILCSTCQSRIRVKNANMIGQVANCPKCGSMIMIAAPRQIQVEGPEGNPVDSMALTQDGISPDLVQGLDSTSNTTPGTETTGSTDELLSRMDGLDYSADDGYRLADDEFAAPPLADSPPNFTDQSPPVENWEPQDPLLPSGEWTSESSTKTRQYLLVGFLGLSGVVLAVIGFVAFLRWYGSPSESNDPIQQPADTLASSGTLPESTPKQEPSVPTVEPENVTIDETTGPGTPSDDLAIPGEADEATDPTNATQTSDATTDALPNELPPGLDTEDQPLDETPYDDADPNEDAKLALPNERLQRFAPVLDWQLTPMIQDNPQAMGPPPITAAELGLSSTGGRDPIPPIDWAKQSSLILPGLKFADGTPAFQALNIWTHLSGIPTVFDMDSVAAANLEPSQSIKVGTLQDVSMRDSADSIAASMNLITEFTDDRYLKFRASETAIESVIPKTLTLEGLVDVANPAQSDWLLQSLSRLLGKPANAFSIQGGELAYDAAQVDLITWFKAIRLLENLRSARGLPAGTERYPEARLSQRFVGESQLQFLDTIELGEITPQARPVGQVLSRVCRNAGAQCWIDWNNVAQVGLGPMSASAVVTYNRKLKNILNDFADDYGLVFAIEDESSLWVTSPAAYRQQPRLYVIPADGRTVEQWQQILLQLTPLDSNGVSELIVVATLDSQFMLVRCCRPTLRF